MAVGDVSLQRGASSALTITLASLATSSARTTGRESTAVTSGDVIDYLVSGKIALGTSPDDLKQIDLWIYASLSDTPTYPDGFTGSDSGRSVTSAASRNSGLVHARSISTENVSDRQYSIAPFSVAALFGGMLPKYWGVWVTHDTGVNFNSTSGNHVLTITPVYAHVAQS